MTLNRPERNTKPANLEPAWIGLALLLLTIGGLLGAHFFALTLGQSCALLLGAGGIGAGLRCAERFIARRFKRRAAQTAPPHAAWHWATVEALATAIDAKDQSSHNHIRRMQIYAVGLGRALGLPADELDALKAGAMLHDVGKLAVPDHILNKPGRLTGAEFERMKRHTQVGAEILARVPFPFNVVPIVRHHHERWDGTGYPDKLCGAEIPLAARIIAVADAYDTMREDRPFRRQMSRVAALDALRQNAGTRFDPQLIEIFIARSPELEAEAAAQNLLPTVDFDERASSASVAEKTPADVAAQAAAPAPTLTLAAPAPLDPLSEIQLSRESARGSSPVAPFEQIKHAHREVYALYEIARTFGSSLSVADTLAIVVNRIGKLVPFETCVIYLYDELQGTARAAHIVGKNAELLQEREINLNEGVTGFVMSNRRAVHRVSPLLDLDKVVGVAPQDYASMAALPLCRDEALIGAITLFAAENNAYTEEDMQLLEMVARLAADALANATQHATAEANALTDALTGLPNARSMYLHFEQETARARRTGEPFHVVMLDLDEFKQVNDAYGHKTGDKLLREIARLLTQQLREYDFLARYAGDEFVAVVQNMTVEQVRELCRRIETVVSGYALRVRGERFARVGISVGAATYDTDGTTFDELLIAADEAMYAAKARQRSLRLKAEGHAVEPAEEAEAVTTSAAVN